MPPRAIHVGACTGGRQRRPRGLLCKRLHRACAGHQNDAMQKVSCDIPHARPSKTFHLLALVSAAVSVMTCLHSCRNNCAGHLRGACAGRRRARCRTCRARLRAARRSASWALCQRWRACCPALTHRSAASSSQPHAVWSRRNRFRHEGAAVHASDEMHACTDLHSLRSTCTHVQLVVAEGRTGFACYGATLCQIPAVATSLYRGH